MNGWELRQGACASEFSSAACGYGRNLSLIKMILDAIHYDVVFTLYRSHDVGRVYMYINYEEDPPCSS